MRTSRRGGIVKVLFGLLFLGAVGFLAYGWWLNREQERQARQPVYELPPPVVPPPGPAAPKPPPRPSGYIVGDRVEVIGPFVCETLELLRTRTTGSMRPPSREDLGNTIPVAEGDPAEVEDLQPGAVLVRLVGGRAAGQRGWLWPQEVRKPPAPEKEESAAEDKKKG